MHREPVNNRSFWQYCLDFDTSPGLEKLKWCTKLICVFSRKGNSNLIGHWTHFKCNLILAVSCNLYIGHLYTYLDMMHSIWTSQTCIFIPLMSAFCLSFDYPHVSSLFKGLFLPLPVILPHCLSPICLSIHVSITICVGHFVLATCLVYRGLKVSVTRRRCLRASNLPAAARQRKDP